MMVRHRCRRQPPTVVLGGLIFSAAALITFYLSLNLPIDKDNASHSLYVDKNEVASLEARLHKLENAQMANRNAINKLVDTVAKLHDNSDGVPRGLETMHVPNWLDQDMAFTSNWSEVFSPSCGVAKSPTAKTDVQMLALYDKIDFVNTDGGVWKQGWKLEYEENQWNTNNKLRVFVVPHSHNDPGWVKTFDKYYLDHTQHIFNNMIDKLGENSERKFIWAEVVYLAYWWDKVDDKKRNILKRYVENGQLEIVTGGWVMTDEASAHYYAMLEQLIEGHQWVKNHLDYIPQNGWAIDPFGLSSTMAYLLKRTNISHMVVQRVHYSVKKELARQKACEFHWRQLWDQSNSTDIICHVMPFYSYDVPHSCGPDPMVCCQFDFRRLPGGKMMCPWKKPPVPITAANVAERAQTLLDQYRKKSLLFRTNVVLIPLGDDFRYDKSIEWDQQYTNYQKLFDHMNSQPSLNVQAKFGTLKDYFEAFEEELIKHPAQDHQLPSLSGDFFTYADREDHYWSGYFSSRPIYKNMDRSLECYLRAGEIVFSLALARATFRGVGEIDLAREMLPKIVAARRSLSLFQHHDAIAGTAKDVVVIDYANRLLTGIRDMQLVIGRSVAFLTSPEGTPYSSDFQAVAFDLDDHRESYFSLPRKSLVEIPHDGRSVVFYNSLAQRRRESVTLVVSSSKVCVNDANGATVVAQLIPLWDTESISTAQYELVFNVDVPALGSALYRIVPSDDLSLWKDCVSISTVKVYNSVREPASHSVFKVEGGASSSFQLTNSHVVASFSEDGLLEGIGMKRDGLSIQAKLSFYKYGTRNSKDKSGAYLFLPGEHATPIVFQKPYYRIIEGPLLSEVQVFLPHVAHRVQLKNSAGIDGFGIDILNVVNISRELNKELVMRFETSVDSGNEFFTDLNGFQIVKRKMYAKIPIQGNFYPIPTTAFIQDEHNRFTVITGQPLGGTSLNPGWLEIVLDRRLGQDDNRGLGQGVLDNKQTLSSFRLLLEKRISSNNLQATPMGFASLVGALATNTLLHPVLRLIASATSPGAPMPPIVPSFRPLRSDLPCDMHVLNLRTLMTETDGDIKTFTLQDATALVLHRIGFDCQIATPDLGCQLTDGKVTIGDHLADYFKDAVTQTSLSLLYDGVNFSKTTSQQRLSVMELQAYKLYR